MYWSVHPDRAQSTLAQSNDVTQGSAYILRDVDKEASCQMVPASRQPPSLLGDFTGLEGEGVGPLCRSLPRWMGLKQAVAADPRSWFTPDGESQHLKRWVGVGPAGVPWTRPTRGWAGKAGSLS